ncbi:MAG: leucine-rich repeat domain-containing protein [Promethearchaeota archaeon]
MTAPKEFQINQFLSLRLERGRTIIYIAGERFIQCKRLLLDIPLDEMDTFEEVESIDEAAEKMESLKESEISKLVISPEVEFWGHCSNLQVWHEHDYDTRLLHSNLAFALLGKLAEVGDPLAKKKFKLELIERYINGSDRTRESIADSGAFKYFSTEEWLNLKLNTEDVIALTELGEEVWTDREPHTIIQALIAEEAIKIENRKVVKLDLSGVHLELEEFPRAILKLKNLAILYIGSNYIKEIPEEINNLNLLKELVLDSNEISYIPDSIFKLTSLERLEINGNKIQALPKEIGNLKNLKTLGLGSNEIANLPMSLYELKSLETLFLGSNKLKYLSDSFCRFKSLKWLSLSNNHLKKLPECLINLPYLEYLDIRKNPLLESTVKLLKKIKEKNIKIWI